MLPEIKLTIQQWEINRFVYWPDYKVAGRAKDISEFFIKHNYSYVRVGSIDGNPRIVRITPEVVLANSYDPLNPRHSQYLQASGTNLGRLVIPSPRDRGNLERSRFSQIGRISLTRNWEKSSRR